MNTRTVLITGASSGIGAALVRRIASPETALYLHARSSAEALASVADAARAQGAGVETALGDLAEEGVAEALVSGCRAAFGGLDVLVANAGFPLIKSYSEGTAADIDYAFRGNLFSFFALARAAGPDLTASARGRIVALGSFTAHVFRTGMMQFPMSAASKGALETAVRSLAIELAPAGVTVNCVVPGYIEKDRGTRHGIRKERFPEIRASIPLGRMGRPDEVAAMIEFLVSADASYVTGQAIHVSGGLV